MNKRYNVLISNTITDVIVETDDSFVVEINFVLSDNSIISLRACKGPGTSSWFHIFCNAFDPNYLAAKEEITRIIREDCVGKSLQTIELDDNNFDVVSVLRKYETVENYLIKISFTDGSIYELVMRNDCDDCEYNGWIEVYHLNPVTNMKYILPS